MNWTPLLLSFQLALVTTVILLLIGVPIAYWLAYSKRKIRPVFEALINLPLVLPPTVIGFYLLMTFGPGTSLGAWLNNTIGLELAFSFTGLVIGSVIYSLPFMIQPIQSGFQNLSTSLKEASYTLGKSRSQTLFKVLLPNIKSSVIAGTILSFAHTIGEFGIVLMIGGNIPGKTRVASIAIYDEFEQMNNQAANSYSLILIGLMFFILILVYSLNRKSNKSSD